MKEDVVLYGFIFFCMSFYSFLHNATKAYISIFQLYAQSSSHLFQVHHNLHKQFPAVDTPLALKLLLILSEFFFLCVNCGFVNTISEIQGTFFKLIPLFYGHTCYIVPRSLIR